MQSLLIDDLMSAGPKRVSRLFAALTWRNALVVFHPTRRLVFPLSRFSTTYISKAHGINTGRQGDHGQQ